MNFQQLRIIREAVRRDFNLTEVANALFTSQPGVSKHIKDIEDELGIEIFIRKGKRILGLTEPGKALVGVVDRMLMDAQNLRRIADQFSSTESGCLSIATTHTQARYVLPQILRQFREQYPNVHLIIYQVSPQEVAEFLHQDKVDIGIAAESLGGVPELLSFESSQWEYAVIVPDAHPLSALDQITLSDIANYPIITHPPGFNGRLNIENAFIKADLKAEFVLSAIDSDVIKTYVEAGLGIGIITEKAFDPVKDKGIQLLPIGSLFPRNITHLALHRRRYLKGYAYRFIENIIPGLTEDDIAEFLLHEEH